MRHPNQYVPIKEYAFPSLVLTILRQNNPDLKTEYFYTDGKYHNICDAFSYGFLDLDAFKLGSVQAKKILIEIKVRCDTETIESFLNRHRSHFDAIVFIIGGASGPTIRDLFDGVDGIRVITEADLLKNPEYEKYRRIGLDEYINDPDNLLTGETPLQLPEGETALALGAGCSIDAHISNWNTLSRALGYALLYNAGDPAEKDSYDSDYKRMLIANAINDSLFDSFDCTSALDAIYQKFPSSSANEEDKANKLKYWETIKNILYMSYDPKGELTDLMASIVYWIRKKHIRTVINYNFDSVLEQSLDRGYTSIPDEIKSSTTKVDNCEIKHVHGYIPYDYDGKTTVEHFIFTDKEYYNNMHAPNSFTNKTQDMVFQNNNVYFIGLSFVDSNLKDRLRKRVREGYTTKAFAFLKLPGFAVNKDSSPEDKSRYGAFNFKGTCVEKVKNRYKLIMQLYFDSLGVKIIWVDTYKDIPKKIDAISGRPSKTTK